MTRVCAVVVTYNRAELLRECLAALGAQTRVPDHVLVVDNASTDGSRDLVAAEFPAAELLALRANGGSAGGFHAGMRHALAAGGFDWLWVMDDDTIPEPAALSELLAAPSRLDGLPPAALLYSRILWRDGSLHPMNVPGYNLGRGGRFSESVAVGLPALRWATFPSLLVSTAAVARHGPPRERFFLWGDDIDFTARILRHEPGYFVPSSVALHKTAAPHEPWHGGPRFYYAARNGIYLLRGDALGLREKVSFAFLMVEQISRYLPHERWRPRAWATVARGLRDGVLSRVP